MSEEFSQNLLSVHPSQSRVSKCFYWLKHCIFQYWPHSVELRVVYSPLRNSTLFVQTCCPALTHHLLHLYNLSLSWTLGGNAPAAVDPKVPKSSLVSVKHPNPIGPHSSMPLVRSCNVQLLPHTQTSQERSTGFRPPPEI